VNDTQNSKAEQPSASPGSSGGTHREWRKTTSGILLHRAVTTLGVDVVAPSLGLTAAELERLDASDKPMTLEQQRTVALAVLVLSEEHPDLRRRAAALLAQVRAAVDFAAGVTERHAGSPPTNRW
jgi:hypothetical protein